MESSEVTNWLQGVGSIGSVVAIFASFWLGSLQSKRELENLRQHAQEDQERTRRYILAIVENAGATVRKIKGWAEDQDANRATFALNYHPSIVDDQIRLLNAMPITELGSANAATALVAVGNKLHFVKSEIERWKGERLDPTATFPGYVEQRNSVFVTNLQTFINGIESDLVIMRRGLDEITAAMAVRPTKNLFKRLLRI